MPRGESLIRQWNLLRTLQAHRFGLPAEEWAETTEFKRWLLGFGRHARVLCPRGLAAEIADELAAASKAYGRRGEA